MGLKGDILIGNMNNTEETIIIKQIKSINIEFTKKQDIKKEDDEISPEESEAFDQICEVSFKLQQYCRENYLPIFNACNTNNIIANTLL